jgi:signal transduction histidine kinase
VRTKTLSTVRSLFGIVPTGVAFCGLIVTIVAAQMVALQETARTSIRSSAEARHVAAQLKVGLLQAVEPLSRIAAWWLVEGRPTAPDDWQSDAELFISAKAGLEKVIWLDATGRPSWSAQPGLPPQTAGLEARDANLQAALDGVRRINATALSPAFGPDSKSFFYACTPIRTNGHLVGYVAGMYNAAEFIGSLLQNQLHEQFRIRVIANGRAFHVPATPATLSEAERQVPMSVANVTWTVAVSPSHSGRGTLEQSVMSFGVIGSLLLYLCAAMGRTSRKRARDLEAVNSRLVFENQERRRAEEKVAQLNRDLMRKLEEFQTLLDVLPVGIAVAEDPECRQVWMNRALGKTLNLPLGTNISLSSADSGEAGHQLLRNGVEVPPAELPMQIAARTQAPVADHYLDIVRSDGSVRRTLSYAAPLFDEKGNVRGVINACVDITERKQLEDRLQQAEKYQSLALMAGGIAHDFNNLLTVIMGNAASVAVGVPAHSTAGQALDDVQIAAAKAAELVKQLLAFTGRFWCEVRPFVLSAEIETMAPQLREIVPTAVAIRYDLAPDLPLISAGATELRQVLESLVANAVEALTDRSRGVIQIRTSLCELSARDIAVMFPDAQLSAGTYVRLEITDNGCGIPDEILPRVFDPFFTTKFVGRGLGLSAVQGIVRAHGGAIRLDSSVHEGTRAELIFPARPTDPTPRNSEPAARSSAAPELRNRL